MLGRESPPEGGRVTDRATVNPSNDLALVTEWRGRGEPMILAWVAGALFLAEGLYISTYRVSLLFGSVSLPSAGAISAVAGLTVVFLAALYRSYGSFRPYIGTLLVLIATGDLWFGGGFWVGSVLGTIAGVLIIALPPYPISHHPRSFPGDPFQPPF